MSFNMHSILMFFFNKYDNIKNYIKNYIKNLLNYRALGVVSKTI